MRVSDVVEARQPTSTTSQSSLEYDTDHASMSRSQMEIDSEEQDYELSQSVSLEGNGVLFSKQDTKESMMNSSQDVEEKILVDPSTSCHTTIEDP